MTLTTHSLDSAIADYLSQPYDDTKLSSSDKAKFFANGYAECARCHKKEYDEAKVHSKFALFEIRWITQYTKSKEQKDSRDGLLLCSECFDRFWVDFLGKKQLYPSYRK